MIARTNRTRTRSSDSACDLVSEMKGLIGRRAGRNVSDLRIEKVANRIVVRGTARSYYAWQLVQTACRDALSGAADLALDCAMTVREGSGRPD